MTGTFLKDAAHGPHGEHLIHFANSYLGPQSHRSIAMLNEAIMTREASGTSFTHHPVFGNGAIQSGSREAIAKILATDVGNITLTANTNEALYIIRNGLGLKREDQVVIYRSEYLDVLSPFIQRADSSHGCSPIFVEGIKDQYGRPLGFDIAEFESAIESNNPSLVVVTHVQFTNGFTTDLAALSAICKKNGVPLVVDAAQSFGALEINPDELGLSALVCPLWKWVGGYRGTAFLWTSPEFRDKLEVERISASGLQVTDWLTDLRTAAMNPNATRFEQSTLATEAWIPTSVMLNETFQQGIQKIEPEIRRLQVLAREYLKYNDRIEVYKDSTGADSKGTFIAISLKDPYIGREAEVVEILQNNPRKRIDITARGGFIRLALHKYTSDQSLFTVCEELRLATDSL